MSKPLKSVMTRVIVLGNLKAGYSETVEDIHGNPISIKLVGKLDLTVKLFNDQPKYRQSYGVMDNRAVVECFVINSWIKDNNDRFISKRLRPSDFTGSLKNEQITLTILETNQSNLKPITKIFGLKFKAILDGTL